jgi:nitrosocyanin
VKRAIVLTVAAVLSGLLLAACGNEKTEHFRINAAVVNGAPGFSVGTITATDGDKVEIRVDNDTEKDHGFSIDAYNIHRVVKPHEPQTVTFTANKPGEFRIYCQLHAAHQPARLIVVG